MWPLLSPSPEWGCLEASAPQWRALGTFLTTAVYWVSYSLPLYMKMLQETHFFSRKYQGIFSSYLSSLERGSWNNQIPACLSTESELPSEIWRPQYALLWGTCVLSSTVCKSVIEGFSLVWSSQQCWHWSLVFGAQGSEGETAAGQ